MIPEDLGFNGSEMIMEDKDFKVTFSTSCKGVAVYLLAKGEEISSIEIDAVFKDKEEAESRVREVIARSRVLGVLWEKGFEVAMEERIGDTKQIVAVKENGYAVSIVHTSNEINKYRFFTYYGGSRKQTTQSDSLKEFTEDMVQLIHNLTHPVG